MSDEKNVITGTTKDIDATKSSSQDTAAPPGRNATNSEPGNTASKAPEEFGGPQGPEPTRFGDWERNGRCTDF